MREPRNETLCVMLGDSNVLRIFHFFILHLAFSVRHWFRFRISYLVLSIPTRSCETHCLRPALLSLPGVLYSTARGGGSIFISRRSLHATILFQPNGDFAGQQGSYLECPHPRKATSNSGSRSSDRFGAKMGDEPPPWNSKRVRKGTFL